MYTNKVHFLSVDEFSEMHPISLGSGVWKALLVLPPLLQTMYDDPQGRFICSNLALMALAYGGALAYIFKNSRI